MKTEKKDIVRKVCKGQFQTRIFYDLKGNFNLEIKRGTPPPKSSPDSSKWKWETFVIQHFLNYDEIETCFLQSMQDFRTLINEQKKSYSVITEKI